MGVDRLPTASDVTRRVTMGVSLLCLLTSIHSLVMARMGASVCHLIKESIA